MQSWRRALGCVVASAVLAFTRHARAQASAQRSDWTPEVEEAEPAHHARTWWQMASGLGLGISGYWLLKEGNVTDWDRPRLTQRFSGSAWTFDNNDLGINFLGHPWTGALAHSLARANHHSVGGAFAYSFLTSFLWEFAVEFKEKVSVNDVIVTPGAGLPLGEFFYKLGLYLDTGSEGVAAVEVGRWLLGSGVALDRWLDGRTRPQRVRRDNLGFSSAIWHEFSVRYGATEVTSGEPVPYARWSVGAGARLVTLRGYAAPRRFARGFWRAEISDFAWASEASRHGVGVAFDADTLLAGYHAQDMRRVGQVVRGAAMTVGSSIGFAYLRSSANHYPEIDRAVHLPAPDVTYHRPESREQFGAFDLPGVAADLRVRGALGNAELSTRLSPSFTGMGAAAFYAWAAANRSQRAQHILHRRGYFYGWGGSARARARLELGPFRAGFELRYARYASQGGLDRRPEQVTVEVPATGDLLRYAVSLGVAPERSGVCLQVDWGLRRFRSTVGGFETTARATERGLSAVWTF